MGRLCSAGKINNKESNIRIVILDILWPITIVLEYKRLFWPNKEKIK